MEDEMDYELVDEVFNNLAEKVQVVAEDILYEDIDADHVLEGMAWLLILFNEWGKEKGLFGEELFREIHSLFELVGEEDPVTTKSIEEIVDGFDETESLFKKIEICAQLSEKAGKMDEFKIITKRICKLLEKQHYLALCHRDSALEDAMEMGDETAINSYTTMINIYLTFRDWFKEISSGQMNVHYYANCLINEEWDYRAFSLVNVINCCMEDNEL